MAPSLAGASIAALAQGVRTGQWKARSWSTPTSTASSASTKAIGAFCWWTPAGARRRADEIDARVAAGRRVGAAGRRAVALKDLYVTRGLETTPASKILRGFVPPTSRPARPAGGRRGSRARQAEHGRVRHGLVQREQLARPVRNPWDLERVPGRIVRAARPPRWRPRCARGRWAPTPAVHPPAGRPVRDRGDEGDLRAGLALRRDRLRLVAGPPRAPSGAPSRTWRRSSR
jgi:hypothetical protein